MVDYLPLLELRKIEGKDMLEEIEQSGGPEEEEGKNHGQAQLMLR